MKEECEITLTDSLLVSRKKPASLAKFLYTSTAFRTTVGLHQLEDNIAFVKNSGWAPQRFNNRAMPFARESRRWDAISNALEKNPRGMTKIGALSPDRY